MSVFVFVNLTSQMLNILFQVLFLKYKNVKDAKVFKFRKESELFTQYMHSSLMNETTPSRHCTSCWLNTAIYKETLEGALQ